MEMTGLLRTRHKHKTSLRFFLCQANTKKVSVPPAVASFYVSMSLCTCVHLMWTCLPSRACDSFHKFAFGLTSR